MPPPPTIRAKVVDVRADTPKSSDVFYVDTNVWFWAAFPRFGLLPTKQQPAAHKLADYPAFLTKAVHCLLKAFSLWGDFIRLAGGWQAPVGQLFVRLHRRNRWMMLSRSSPSRRAMRAAASRLSIPSSLTNGICSMMHSLE